jgi:signal transduction histidine kinase
MLGWALFREQTSLAAPLQSIPTDFAVPERLYAMDRMVALISHDFRLPLAVILGNAEFLTRSEISGIEKNEFYHEIRWAVDRMNESIFSLFACSRNCDRLGPAARINIGTPERAIRTTCVRQKYRRVTITHHHRGHAVARFDSNCLERVIANFVLNACEAVSSDSGQVVITMIGSQASLQICVWDNGPGIPPTGAPFSTICQPRKGQRQRAWPGDSEEDWRGSRWRDPTL